MYAQDIFEDSNEAENYEEVYSSSTTSSGIRGVPGRITTESGIKGNGTQIDPYIILDEEDLLIIADEVNNKNNTYKDAYFEIDAEESIEIKGNWVPIGNKNTPFKGNINGNSVTISGIRADGNITPSGISYYGFFGYVENAEIKNFIVSGSAINYDNVAGIAGNSKNSSFINCINYVNISGSTNAGGISAVDDGSDFENCINKVNVISTKGTAGGIVSNIKNYTRLKKCYNHSLVEGKIVGGVVGNIEKGMANINSDLEGCYNEGTVTGTDYTGGVVGKVGDYCILTDCYNNGQVYGSGKYTSGVAAYLGANALIENCYNYLKGTIIGTGNYTSGVFGDIQSNKTAGATNMRLSGLYNAGTVTGSGNYTSGVLGSVPANMGDNITYCYNIGTVVGKGNKVAGICGTLQGIHMGNNNTTSRLNLCYNLGEVKGEGENTEASGINTENMVAFGPRLDGSWVVNCFNYGNVSSKSEKVAAITYVGYPINKNCYYLEGSAGSKPEDFNGATVYDAAAFSSGQVAYALDKGDDAGRLKNWGQGKDYPVPVSSENPAVYKIDVKVTGKGENKVIHKGIKISAGSSAYVYGSVGKRLDFKYEIEEGHMLDNISFGTTDLNAVLDEASKTFSFTLKKTGNTSIFVRFMQTPEGLKDEYSVIYDANGGKWMDGSTKYIDMVKAGSRTVKPVMEPYFPSTPGVNNVFKGWFADKECSIPYNFTSAIVEDITIYAGWQNMQKHTVTFDAAGGLIEGEPSLEKEVVTGNVVEKPVMNPVKEDFNFRGWYTDEDCLYLYDFENPVTGELILYAGWTPVGKCIVVFDANEGTVAQGGEKHKAISLIINKGESVRAMSASKEPKGSSTFDLEGWYTSSGSRWDFAEPVNESMTLTAKWKENFLQNPREDGSYEIDGLGALEALRDIINSGDTYEDATFVLTSNIELPADWTAVGTGSDGFKHTFDGGGNTIYFNGKQKSPIFDKLTGMVKDLNIEAGYVSGLSSALAYTLLGGEINGCEVHGIFEGGNAGIVFEQYNGTIRNCKIKSGSEIIGKGCVAGIVAIMRSGEKNSSLIENCTIESGVTLTSLGDAYPDFAVAGIAAYSYDVTIEKCSNSAEIVLNGGDVDGSAGGIVAAKNTVSKNVIIKNCDNTGNIIIKGNRNHIAGGIVGEALVTIENSYSIGNIYSECDSSSIGGLAGKCTSIKNSYWYGEIQWNEKREGKTAGITPYEGAMIENCYYGVNSQDETGVLSDIKDGKGSTKLTAKEFAEGKVAYLLDGGGNDGNRLVYWTQGNGYPIEGSPEYYKITLESDINGGNIDIDGLLELYEGRGTQLTVNVKANEPETIVEGDVTTERTYTLESLKVTQGEKTEDIKDDKIFELTGDAHILASFVKNDVVKYPEKPVDPKDPVNPKDPDDNDDDDKAPLDDGDIKGGGSDDGDGIGDGTGSGIGDGTGGGTDTSTDGNQTGTIDTETGIPVESTSESKNENSSPSISISQQTDDDVVTETEDGQIPPETPEQPEKSEKPEEPEEESEEASTAPVTNKQNSMIPPIAAAIAAALLILAGIYRFIILKKK